MSGHRSKLPRKVHFENYRSIPDALWLVGDDCVDDGCKVSGERLRAAQVLAAIKWWHYHYRKHDPTHEDLAALCGCGKSAVKRAIDVLKDDGYARTEAQYEGQYRGPNHIDVTMIPHTWEDDQPTDSGRPENGPQSSDATNDGGSENEPQSPEGNDAGDWSPKTGATGAQKRASNRETITETNTYPSATNARSDLETAAVDERAHGMTESDVIGILPSLPVSAGFDDAGEPPPTEPTLDDEALTALARELCGEMCRVLEWDHKRLTDSDKDRRWVAPMKDLLAGNAKREPFTADSLREVFAYLAADWEKGGDAAFVRRGLNNPAKLLKALNDPSRELADRVDSWCMDRDRSGGGESKRESGLALADMVNEFKQQQAAQQQGRLAG